MTLKINLKQFSAQIPQVYNPSDKTYFLAEEVQETLLGILGFDDMDFVQDLLTHRDEIIHGIVSLVNYMI